MLNLQRRCHNYLPVTGRSGLQPVLLIVGTPLGPDSAWRSRMPRGPARQSSPLVATPGESDERRRPSRDIGPEPVDGEEERRLRPTLPLRSGAMTRLEADSPANGTKPSGLVRIPHADHSSSRCGGVVALTVSAEGSTEELCGAHRDSHSRRCLGGWLPSPRTASNNLDTSGDSRSWSTSACQHTRVLAAAAAAGGAVARQLSPPPVDNPSRVQSGQHGGRLASGSRPTLSAAPSTPVEYPLSVALTQPVPILPAGEG